MSKSAKRASFEESLARLEHIVNALESGDIGLEESIAQFEEATRLAAVCRKILESAEQRIQKIQADAVGNVATEPLSLSPDSSTTPGEADEA